MYLCKTSFMFQDRLDAGLALAQQLLHYKDMNGVALAVPRGGVPVALPVAKILHIPLEIILSKKIGHPLHKEFAIGAVSLTGRVVAPNAYVSEEYVEEQTHNIRLQLKSMYKKFMGNKEPTSVKNKIVIIIDDGIATGHTMLSTVDMIRKESPKKIVVAVPVASQQAARKLSEAADEFVCVWIPDHFRAVGEFYENFTQVTDEEVMKILEQY
jgi:putative phosphoribosyl transferase